MKAATRLVSKQDYIRISLFMEVDLLPSDKVEAGGEQQTRGKGKGEQRGRKPRSTERNNEGQPPPYEANQVIGMRHVSTFEAPMGAINAQTLTADCDPVNPVIATLQEKLLKEALSRSRLENWSAVKEVIQYEEAMGREAPAFMKTKLARLAQELAEEEGEAPKQESTEEGT